MEYTTLLLDMDGTFLDFSAAEHLPFTALWRLMVIRVTRKATGFIPGSIIVCGRPLNGAR